MPVNRLSDAQLCSELGHAHIYGDDARIAEVITEGKSRETSGGLTISEEICRSLAITGAQAAVLERTRAEGLQASYDGTGDEEGTDEAIILIQRRPATV